MGCTTSKLDDLPAVALCKDRCMFLDETIRQRYTLSQAHNAYLHSLKGMSHSLTEFFQLTESNPGFSNSPPPSPSEKKPDPKQAIDHHSNSGSHLDFHSDEDSGSGSGQSSPLHDHIGYMNMANEHFEHRGGFLRMNFMKNSGVNVSSVVVEQKPVSTESIIHINESEMVKDENLYMNHMRKSNMAIPSVSYEQKPVINERVYHMGDSEFNNSYFSYFSDQMASQLNNNVERYPLHGFNDHVDGGGDYGMMSNHGYSSSWQKQRETAEMSSSKQPPPPPPPPPENSAWGFLNIFESYDKYQQAYTPSRDSREVREEEGIPDLEVDEYNSMRREVVKEVDGEGGNGGDHGHDYDHPESVDSGSYLKSSPEERKMAGGESSASQKRPSTVVEGDGVQRDVHVVDKKVVDGEGRRSEGRGSNAGGFKGVRSFFDVLREIEMQFERASESGEEIARMLEVGKLPYYRKHQVASKMVQVATPPLSAASSSKDSQSTSTSDRSNPASLGFDEEITMSTGNLSSTLQKLYLWEKKLYNEVKSEEKMRVVHDRKVQKLKRLDEKGAEAQKVDLTRTFIRSLSTRIRIAIQVVDKISVTMNKIRDEELWPQLNELIQGLLRMWKSMLECHKNQCQAIKEVKNLSLIASAKKLNDGRLETTLQFERELVNWTFRFHSWVCAQKTYVRALNNWLVKCLLYEPEETDDGIVPFSPGRVGAPPIFVICNQWSLSMDRISEKEVLDSMRAFVNGVNQLWERDKLELHQRMLVNKDLERKVRSLDREDQKIQKEIQALGKKMIPGSGVHDDLLVTGELIYQGDVGNKDLQASLQRVFNAMERFTELTTKEYEDLLQRCEEENLAHKT